MKEFTVTQALRRMTRLQFNLLPKSFKSGFAKTLGKGVLYGVEVAIVVIGVEVSLRAECGQDLRKVNGTANVAQSPSTIYPQSNTQMSLRIASMFTHEREK